MNTSSAHSNKPPPDGTAFLLSQIGAHAAAKFARRLAPLKLASPHAGILRIIFLEPSISQQKLAKMLGMFPSRLVLVLDEMEKLGLVERKPSVSDRRTYALHLTAKGKTTFEKIGRIAREHEQELCSALTPKEQQTLASLLARIFRHQHLTPGVHPGFRYIGRNQKSC